MQKKKRQKTDHIEMMTGIQEERKQRKERVLFFLPPAQCVLCESHADSGDLFWAPGFRAEWGKFFFGGVHTHVKWKFQARCLIGAVAAILCYGHSNPSPENVCDLPIAHSNARF